MDIHRLHKNKKARITSRVLKFLHRQRTAMRPKLSLIRPLDAQPSVRTVHFLNVIYALAVIARHSRAL